MKTITLLNEKGGVGKTTLSVHLAAGLAIAGLRVLVLDTDAQAHSTHQLRVKEFGGLYRLIAQEEPWKDVLRVPTEKHWAGSAAKGTLWLVPSNIETRAITAALSDDPLVLRDRLEELYDHVDYVIIDTSPTPSLLHSIIYLATDALIYPTQCEMLSLQGTGKSALHRTQINRQRKAFGLPDIPLLGVQPTMYLPQTAAHQYGLAALTKNPEFVDRVWEPIAARTIWRDAGFAQETLFAYAPEHEATRQVWGMVERVRQAMEAHHARA